MLAGQVPCLSITLVMIKAVWQSTPGMIATQRERFIL